MKIISATIALLFSFALGAKHCERELFLSDTECNITTSVSVHTQTSTHADDCGTAGHCIQCHVVHASVLAPSTYSQISTTLTVVGDNRFSASLCRSPVACEIASPFRPPISLV